MNVAGSDPLLVAAARGSKATLVVVDEGAYVSSRFMAEFVLPLLMVRGTSLVTATTPAASLDNWVRVSVALRCDNGNRVLQQVDLSGRCDICVLACSNTCAHRPRARVAWKDDSRLAILGPWIDAIRRNGTANRELLCQDAGDDSLVFGAIPLSVLRAAGRHTFAPRSVSRVIVSVDPGAGRSPCAVVSVVLGMRRMTVSPLHTERVVLLAAHHLVRHDHGPHEERQCHVVRGPHRAAVLEQVTSKPHVVQLADRDAQQLVHLCAAGRVGDQRGERRVAADSGGDHGQEALVQCGRGACDRADAERDVHGHPGVRPGHAPERVSHANQVGGRGQLTQRLHRAQVVGLESIEGKNEELYVHQLCAHVRALRADPRYCNALIAILVEGNLNQIGAARYIAVMMAAGAPFTWALNYDPTNDATKGAWTTNSTKAESVAAFATRLDQCCVDVEASLIATEGNGETIAADLLSQLAVFRRYPLTNGTCAFNGKSDGHDDDLAMALLNSIGFGAKFETDPTYVAALNRLRIPVQSAQYHPEDGEARHV